MTLDICDLCETEHTDGLRLVAYGKYSMWRPMFICDRCVAAGVREDAHDDLSALEDQPAEDPF
jgi:hypothetical protein